MNFEKFTKKVGRYNNYDVEFYAPSQCPHCGLFNNPSIVTTFRTNYNSYILYVIMMKSNCCEKNYFACYLDENNILPIKLKKDCFLLSYPEPKNELPEKIIELSPRFHNLYSQAYCVELKGHFELAGCGYRNALEILIKDFAVKELKISEEEVQKQSLCTSIKKYLTKNLLNNAAEVVRILGNSYTHYKNEYPNIDFYVLKDYLSIIINDIDRVVKLKHPPVRGVNTV